MRPWAHDERGARRLASARVDDADIVVDRAVRPVRLVVPGREVQHRRAGAIVLAAQLRPVPPGIVRGMTKPVVIPRRDCLEFLHGHQWKRSTKAVFDAVPWSTWR